MNYRSKGFTIVELLVVISIIGILSTISIVGVKTARERSKVSKAKTDVSKIGLAVTTLYSDTRYYPGGVTRMNYSDSEVALDGSTAGLLTAGTSPSGGIPNWKGPYLPASTSLVDPWGHKYYFDGDYYGYPYDGVRQVVGTYGEDFGGDPDNATVATNGMYNCDDIFFEMGFIIESSVVGSAFRNLPPPASPKTHASILAEYRDVYGVGKPKACVNFAGKVN